MNAERIVMNLMLKPIYTVSVRHPFTSQNYIKSDFLLLSFVGRTGRFGRKGISINFVHDQKTWSHMNQIEQALGKEIIRIETNDLNEMEQVRFTFIFVDVFIAY
jgi:superfamily II DNA/RNA helicase